MSSMGAGDEFDSELSEPQIDVLLRQAEARARAQLQSSNTRDTRYQSIVSKPNTQFLGKTYVQKYGEIAKVDPEKVLQEKDRSISGIRKVVDPIVFKRQILETKKATAGSGWYNMPRTNLTPELKRHLQLLKLRNVLDPKRHYKKESSKARVPEFSQVGTIKEGPTEFFSARMSNRERKKSFVEEVLNGEHETGRFKRKYLEIQSAKTSGKKGHYKASQAKRYGKKFRG